MHNIWSFNRKQSAKFNLSMSQRMTKTKEEKEEKEEKSSEKGKDDISVIRTVSYDQLAGLLSPTGNLYQDSYSTHYPLLLKDESKNKLNNDSKSSDSSELSDSDEIEEKETLNYKINSSQLIKDEDGKYPILNQVVAFGGADCSPGFAQSIALARIYVRTKSKIIILDEAMTQIDPLKIRNIILPRLFEHVKKLNLCLIIITHSPISIGKVDYFYVLEQGTVVHAGTPKQLLEENAEIYMRLMNLQNQKGYDWQI